VQVLSVGGQAAAGVGFMMVQCPHGPARKCEQGGATRRMDVLGAKRLAELGIATSCRILAAGGIGMMLVRKKKL
jgi:hypothetical protein